MLVADLFAVLVLPVALLIILVVEIFAIGQRRTTWGANPELAGPLLGVLTAGVSLAILTGDLFTLFVAFELILVSSYVLLTHQGKRGQIRSGMTYVVMNLFASTLFLFGVAFVYAATGTINIALLAERIPELDSGVRLGIGAWFFVVFGTKAAIFPLFSWLPDSYPTAPTTITAVFAGLLTKIGIYSMIRFHTLTGMDELGPIMLIVAGVTMVIGALGALAQSDVKRILSFHVISQIGYMLMGLGLFSAAGTTGAILFLIHHMPVKTVLFLVGGLIENHQGSSSLDRSGGLAARRPLIAALFAIPALSLAGLPPFSGFVAKFAVISAGIDAGFHRDRGCRTRRRGTHPAVHDQDLARGVLGNQCRAVRGPGRHRRRQPTPHVRGNRPRCRRHSHHLALRRDAAGSQQSCSRRHPRPAALHHGGPVVTADTDDPPHAHDRCPHPRLVRALGQHLCCQHHHRCCHLDRSVDLRRRHTGTRRNPARSPRPAGRGWSWSTSSRRRRTSPSRSSPPPIEPRKASSLSTFRTTAASTFSS